MKAQFPYAVLVFALSAPAVATAQEKPNVDSFEARFNSPLPDRAIERFGSGGIKLNGLYGKVGGTLSPDGRYLAVVEKPQSAVVYDLTSGKVACRPTYPRTFTSLLGGDDGNLILGFSADGQSLFFGANANFARFEIPSGKSVQRMGQESFRSVYIRHESSSLSRDGSRCVVVSTEYKGTGANSVRVSNALVLDTKTGKPVATVVSGSELVSLSPDGSRIITGGTPGNHETKEQRIANGRVLLVWDVDKQKEIARLKIDVPDSPGADGYYGTYNCIAFAPDGKSAAVGVADIGIYLFDTATGAELRRFPTELEMRPQWVRFSPDGKTLVAAGRKLWAWKAATGEAIPLQKIGGGAEPDRYHSVSFPKGGLMVLADVNNTLVWWDALTGASSHPLVGHAAGVEAIKFRPDGKSLVSASADGRVYVWSPGTKTPTTVQKFGGRELHQRFPIFHSIMLSPGGQFVVGMEGPFVPCKAWDVASGKHTFSRRFPGTSKDYPSIAAGPTSVVMSDGMSFKVWTNPDKFDDPEPASRSFEETDRIAVRLDVSQDEKTISALLVPLKSAPPKTPAVHLLLDAATGKRLHALPASGFVSLTSFSPDGKWLFQDGQGGGELYEVATGKLVAKLPLSDDKAFVTAVAFDPQNRRIALATFQKAAYDKGEPCPIEILELPSGKSLLRLPGHRVVRSLAFAPDRDVLASGGDDQVIYLWDCKAP